MQGREELIFGEPDISLGPADGREHVLALEPRHLSGRLGNQNQCQGVFGASIGDEASVEYALAPPGPPARGAVRGHHRSAQRAGSLRRSPPRGARPARARDHTPSAAACRHRGPRGCGLGQRLSAVGAELRAGFVLPAAILASAQCHKVRWPNLLLAASLRHMRLIGATLLVVATGAVGSACASSPAPRRPSVSAPHEPLHITIVYPDTAEPIQARSEEHTSELQSPCNL